jgi:hypothetical protein
MKSNIVSKIFVAAILAPLLLVSCKDSDDFSIIGTWVVTHLELKNCDDSDDNASIPALCTSTDCLTITFTKDKTFTLTIKSSGDVQSSDGTYSQNGNTITLCATGGTCDENQLSHSGSTMTLSAADDTTGCDVSISLRKQ